jgi:DNA-binding protein H-NS
MRSGRHIHQAFTGQQCQSRRQSGERELSRFSANEAHAGLGTGTLVARVVRGFGARGAVAPKYRNPENPAETWAGRGLKPRWLAAAIKSGKKPEDFLIAGGAASKANGGKKTGKAKKFAKK